MGTTTDTIALDEATVTEIQDFLHNARASARTDRTAWATARLSVNRLFANPGARTITREQLDRLIIVVKDATFKLHDPGLTASFSRSRVALWDQLVELRED